MATTQRVNFGVGSAPPPRERETRADGKHKHARSDRNRRASLLAFTLKEVMEWQPADAGGSRASLEARWKKAAERIENSAQNDAMNRGARIIAESISIIRMALKESWVGIRESEELPHVSRVNAKSPVPRSFALAVEYLRAVHYRFDRSSLSRFLAEVQEVLPLRISEVWNLKPFLELVLVQQIGEYLAQNAPIRQVREIKPSPDRRPTLTWPAALVESLLGVSNTDWEDFFKNACLTERIMGQDPARAYETLDDETKEVYRGCVADLAAHSDCAESAVARRAVELARLAQQRAFSSDKVKGRKTHIGYYLLDSGRDALKKAVGYRPSLFTRAREVILRRPTIFYLSSIGTITVAFLFLVTFLLGGKALGFAAAACVVLPALECAIVTINLLATRMFPPRKLPKLDFSKGIRTDCATVVAVPALLSNEKQVRSAVQGLEIRFLANRDPNLHFVLLTDLPDAAQQFDEREKLVALCSGLLQEIDQKYSSEGKGRLFHFHRHRVYNHSEELWMGWERKRGKLLDFNRFLLNQADVFPVKTGEWSLLHRVRYVITLDLDTQLPPGAGQKLVGALAHPLNRAIINPSTNTVVEGYGILQPRVDISIKSSSRSRLASLLSGDTGFDIYTRAVSDVYQDLFGEGIFTGKGIYEVETFQKVLEHRFPCNVVLSHDLIEGVYARTGLVSDIEVVDDYPSHFSAFSRRKHRWIRGDWQLLFNLFPRVPDDFGHFVRNPLSPISRWKIFDNLRRSLTEFSLLVLLVWGWLLSPADALRWTLVAVAIMLFPTFLQSALSVVTGERDFWRINFWRNWAADSVAALGRVGVRLALLCQQSLVDIDAVVRTVVRMKITHKRLLEWETAADAEAHLDAPSFVELYLKYSLLVTGAITLVISLRHAHSLKIALPFLILWASAIWICEWLSHPHAPRATAMDNTDRDFVRHVALRTWRFFRDFSHAGENWLIPDIVQQTPPLTAHRISPTNLGLLLNARLAAHDLGFVTTEEFVRDTEKTLETARRMPKYRGHFYNWYTTDTLQPVAPLFVSTVDSGNLLASLWTLKQGCLETIRQPLLRPVLLDGIGDQIAVLAEALPKDRTASEWTSAVCDLRRRLDDLASGRLGWGEGLRALDIDASILLNALSKAGLGGEARALSIRIGSLLKVVETLAPWSTPYFQEVCPLSNSEMRRLHVEFTLESAPRLYDELSKRFCVPCANSAPDPQSHCAQFRMALAQGLRASRDLTSRLTALAAVAQSMADDMDFGFLYNEKQELFSIGFDVEEGISKYTYDLLASEARTAVFAAIAKGQAPPESWFGLKRSFGSYERGDVLLSWSGTAFEYLMPSLWMRTYPNTLLDRSLRAAIYAQRTFGGEQSIPWGISESSCHQRNPDGHYRYHAFGVAGLALHRDDCSGDLVVAPYATFLALMFEPTAAVENLRKLTAMGSLSEYGFYEAADFTPRRMTDSNCEIVRNWMAHHQGMSLVAAANALCDSAMQRRFHAEPCVSAVERLLHEKFPRTVIHEDGTDPTRGAATADPDLAVSGCELGQLIPKPL